MSKKLLVITTTVTITSLVPFDADHYPGMDEQQAIDSELDMAKEENIADCLGNFMMNIEGATFDAMHVPTLRDPKGDLSIKVRMEDVD